MCFAGRRGDILQMAEPCMDLSSCSVITTQFPVLRDTAELRVDQEARVAGGERQSLSPDSGVPLEEARS